MNDGELQIPDVRGKPLVLQVSDRVINVIFEAVLGRNSQMTKSVSYEELVA